MEWLHLLDHQNPLIHCAIDQFGDWVLDFLSSVKIHQPCITLNINVLLTWIAGSLDCSVLLDCRCSFLMNKPSMGSKTTYVFPQFHVHCTTKSNLKKTINYLKALASARSRKWAWILNRIRLLWVVVIFAARRPCNRLCRVNLNWFIATISILSHFKGNLSNKQFNKTTKYSYVG